MHKKTLLLLLLFIANISLLQAQKVKLSVQASINYPWIPSLTTPKEYQVFSGTGFWVGGSNYSQSQELFDYNAGCKIGLNVEHSIKNKLFLKTGIGIDLVRFKRTAIVINYGGFEWRNTSDYYPNLGKTSILYVDIPLGVGYRFFRNKLSVSVGGILSVISYSEQYIRTVYPSGGYGPAVKDNTSDGLNNATFSLDAEASYLFFKKFSVFGRYSYQLNPIFDKDSQYAGKAKLQLFELGLGYQFL